MRALGVLKARAPRLFRQRLDRERDLHLEERAFIGPPHLDSHVLAYSVRHGVLDHLAQGPARVVASFLDAGELQTLVVRGEGLAVADIEIEPAHARQWHSR